MVILTVILSHLLCIALQLPTVSPLLLATTTISQQFLFTVWTLHSWLWQCPKLALKSPSDHVKLCTGAAQGTVNPAAVMPLTSATHLPCYALHQSQQKSMTLTPESSSLSKILEYCWQFTYEIVSLWWKNSSIIWHLSAFYYSPNSEVIFH